MGSQQPTGWDPAEVAARYGADKATPIQDSPSVWRTMIRLGLITLAILFSIAFIVLSSR